ncbi:hypothetical protein RZE82_03055 [Mollicutes bacterium LVI A0039]|nr:hypothetical protein RZE82_03055 [Mollicutes bacterium LVI A0039]
MEKLTKGEKYCNLKLQSLGTEILSLNINQISDLTTYSTATINRLIKKLGFNNIKEYKLYVSKQNPSQHETTYIEDIIRLYQANHTKELEQIKNLINQANVIHVVGKGVLIGPVNELRFGLIKLGYRVVYENDLSYIVGNETNTFSEDDLVIFLSRLGSDDHMKLVAKHVCDVNPTILLTSSPENTLIENMDLVYLLEKKDEKYEFCNAISLGVYKILSFLEKS